MVMTGGRLIVEFQPLETSIRWLLYIYNLVVPVITHHPGSNHQPEPRFQIHQVLLLVAMHRARATDTRPSDEGTWDAIR